MPASNLRARFYNHAFLNVPKSKETGRTVYDDVINVELSAKGDKNTSFSRRKTDQDEIDFPAEWMSFVTGNAVEINGTALKFLPNMSPATEMNLNATGIMTIEDLAAMDDALVIGVQGMVDLRKRAQAYVDSLNEETVDPDQEKAEKPKKKRRKRNPETGELE